VSRKGPDIRLKVIVPSSQKEDPHPRRIPEGPKIPEVSDSFARIDLGRKAYFAAFIIVVNFLYTVAQLVEAFHLDGLVTS
jgi:hypothetical protein